MARVAVRRLAMPHDALEFLNSGAGQLLIAAALIASAALLAGFLLGYAVRSYVARRQRLRSVRDGPLFFEGSPILEQGPSAPAKKPSETPQDEVLLTADQHEKLAEAFAKPNPKQTPEEEEAAKTLARFHAGLARVARKREAQEANPDQTQLGLRLEPRFGSSDRKRLGP
jgi:hypothetical protein